MSGIDYKLLHEIADSQKAILKLCKEVERLERRIEIYEQALRLYSNDNQFFSDGQPITNAQKRDMDDYGSTARRALETVENIRGDK